MRMAFVKSFRLDSARGRPRRPGAAVMPLVRPTNELAQHPVDQRAVLPRHEHRVGSAGPERQDQIVRIEFAGQREFAARRPRR